MSLYDIVSRAQVSMSNLKITSSSASCSMRVWFIVCSRIRWPRGIMGFMHAFWNLQGKFSTAIAMFNFQPQFSSSTVIRYFSFHNAIVIFNAQLRLKLSTGIQFFNVQLRFQLSTAIQLFNFQPRFDYLHIKQPALPVTAVIING